MSGFASLRTLLCAAALGLGAVGCSAEHRERPPPDCSIEEGYDLLTAPTYSNASLYYTAPNPGLPDPKYASTTIAKPEAMEWICGHTEAVTLVFKTQGNHDWGSLIGTYPRPPSPIDPQTGVPRLCTDKDNPVRPCVPANAILLEKNDMDASAYEGISFWARGFYDRAVTILLDDATSNAGAQRCAAGLDQFESDNVTPIGNGERFSGIDGQPYPNACYSQFGIQLVPNPWWTFYTIPFSTFTQGGNTPDARLKPDGIDRSTISRIVIRAPRDAFVENWFANVAWYRKK